MKTILLLAFLSTALFLGSVLLIIIGLFKKKKQMILSAILVFVLFLGFAAWTSFTLMSKSVDRVKQAMAPRTGEEIYDVLFGDMGVGCVKIINYRDQLIPVIDYAIWLHFEICPAELERILAQHEYQLRRLPATHWEIRAGEAIDWFNPRQLGDTVSVFEYFPDELGSNQTLWVSTDSTNVFYRHISD